MTADKSKNLFLVTSPFQLICAIEAKNTYQLKNNILAITEQPHQKGQQQFDALLDSNEWDMIIRLPGTFKAFSIPFFIRKIKKITNNTRVNNILHGEYAAWRTNIVLKNIDHNHEIMFDDGTATINDYNRYLKDKRSINTNKGFKDVLLKLQGITPPKKVSFRENFDLFSIYHFDNFPYAKKINTLDTLRSSINNINSYDPNSPAGFLGQGEVSFDGTNGMKFDSYLELLNRYHKYTGKKVIYFPHRSESKKVRSELEKIPFIIFHDSEWPIELEISKKSIKLSSIAGISSTALYTLALIHNDIPVYSMSQEQCSYYKNTSERLELYKELEIYYSKSKIIYI